MANTTQDQINPIYYIGSKNGHNIELMDVYDAFNLCPMQAFVLKYVVRYNNKGNPLLDLEKAQRCLTRLISNEKQRLDLLESIESISNND
tara:strand:+ start:115 stop:384 length:270 start_codon:yes stop_codon:yes gene_type:complete